MYGDKTFDLPDLNEDVWNKVVAFFITHSSGLGEAGDLWLITEDKKEYCLVFEGLPFSEYELEDNLHPMFRIVESFDEEEHRYRYAIEDEGWHFVRQSLYSGCVRDDLYESFAGILSNVLDGKSDKNEFVFLPEIAGKAMGTDKFDRYDYVKAVEIQRQRDDELRQAEEEHEKVKFLPEHFDWKPLNLGKYDPDYTEYAIIAKWDEDKLVAHKFTIECQAHQREPMHTHKGDGIDCYILFERSYDCFCGPLEYPEGEYSYSKMVENYETPSRKLAFFRWNCLNDCTMMEHGNFLRCFKTKDEAKEYALEYANNNSHKFGNRNTIVHNLTTEEEHRIKVERYEAYLLYGKYYREIMDAIANFDGYQSDTSGGGGYLIEEVLEKVPQISKKQLMYFWRDVPKVIERRTQEVIEQERQRSLDIINAEAME